MQIVSLVENTSHSGLKTVHGLSLYIETDKHKILFDLGPNNTVFQHAVYSSVPKLGRGVQLLVYTCKLHTFFYHFFHAARADTFHVTAYEQCIGLYI